VGLDPWLTTAANLPTPYTDDTIAAAIPNIIRRFERESQFRVNQVQFVTNADGTYDGANGLDITGSMFTYREDPYPFWMMDAQEFFRITLRNRPVQQIQRMRLMWGPGSNIFVIDNSWIHLDMRAGRTWLIPITGSSIVNASAIAWSQLWSFMGYKAYVPNILCIDYVAGLPVNWWDANANPEWSDLWRALAEYVAAGILDDLCETFDPGLTGKSFNADGVNLSLQYDKLVRRRQELRASANSFMQTLKDTEEPVSMVVV